MGPPPWEPPRIVGHRGAAGDAPENTLASFRKASAADARWVEFDVQLSADAHPVVIHDEQLERTTNGRGRVEDCTWAALQKLDAGAWFAREFAGEGLPDLKATLRELKKLELAFNLELKIDPRDEPGALRLAGVVAKELSRARPCLVSSFNWEALRAFKRRLPTVPLGVLVAQTSLAARSRSAWKGWSAVLAELEAYSIHLADRGVTPALVRFFREQNYAVLVYTVNRVARARALFGMGVTGIFTDYPARMRQLGVGLTDTADCRTVWEWRKLKG